MLLHEELGRFRLHYLAENLDDFLAQNQATPPRSLLERIVELENVEKMRRSTEGRLKIAHIGRFKTMAHFDWAWPREIDRMLIEELLEGKFIHDHRNVILAGSQGAGKTQIAKNIAFNAVMQGQRVLFTTAANLVLDLSSQESTAALQRRLRRYVQPNLLVIDELGYLSYDNRAADLLFDIVSKRYETGSIVITTNLAFKEWGQVFQGAACVTALVDRLTHYADIAKIDADSYRTMESAKRSGVKRGAKHAKK